MTTAADGSRLVDSLVTAARDVFETMLLTTLSGGPPVEGEAFRPASNIVATVGFAGGRSGAVVFYCSHAAGARIASGLLGTTDASREDVADAVAEVANMIAGTFRNGVVADGVPCAISIPSVTIGSDFYTRYVSDVRRVLCPLRAWDEELFVELIVTRTDHA